MKYQTLNKKDEKLSLEDIFETFKNAVNKYDSSLSTSRMLQGEISYFKEIKHEGAIILHIKNNKFPYLGVVVDGYIEYLGFRNTKKFNKVYFDVKQSLENICYVHTGEIK